jgi:hypothetical protein
MALRPNGTATISFGLVSIPVNLFSASESKAAISFNMLHDEDHARVKQQLVCSKDGEVVERDHVIKGYEFEKGQYVVFTPAELKALEEQANQVMEIMEFVPLAKVDPVYFDKGYYLSPGKGGDKAYGLLAKAMTETGRCGLAKYAARGGRKGVSKEEPSARDAKPERKPAARADAGEKRGPGPSVPSRTGRRRLGPEGPDDAACEGLRRARRRRDAGGFSRARDGVGGMDGPRGLPRPSLWLP